MFSQWYEDTADNATCSGTTCSVTPSTSLASGNYKWWIQTWNEVGYGPWSLEKSFQVTVAANGFIPEFTSGYDGWVRRTGSWSTMYGAH